MICHRVLKAMIVYIRVESGGLYSCPTMRRLYGLPSNLLSSAMIFSSPRYCVLKNNVEWS